MCELRSFFVCNSWTSFARRPCEQQWIDTAEMPSFQNEKEESIFSEAQRAEARGPKSRSEGEGITSVIALADSRSNQTDTQSEIVRQMDRRRTAANYYGSWWECKQKMTAKLMLCDRLLLVQVIKIGHTYTLPRKEGW